jgi:hypothetical protein
VQLANSRVRQLQRFQLLQRLFNQLDRVRACQRTFLPLGPLHAAAKKRLWAIGHAATTRAKACQAPERSGASTSARCSWAADALGVRTQAGAVVARGALAAPCRGITRQGA